MTIKAIIFDLGGTLIEYVGPYARWPEMETPGFTAAYDYLRQQGARLPGFARFRDVGFEMLPGRWQLATAGVKNLRLVDLLADVLQKCGVNSLAPSQLAGAAELYQDAVCGQARLVAAAAETLAQVKGAGYKIGLLSNTMFTGAAHKRDLRRFGLIDYFDAMLFSADVGKWKPNVAPFRHVLAELGVAPEAAVYVGDDPASDVVGGRRAGMRAIHFQSSQRFHNPDGAKPDARIHSLVEVLPILSNWMNNPA